MTEVINAKLSVVKDKILAINKTITPLDIFLSVLVMLFYWLLPAIMAFVLITPIAVIYPALTKKWEMYPFLVAGVAIAFSWVFVAQDFYGYNVNYPEIYGLSLFPLMAMYLGLFGTYFLYMIFLGERLENRSFIVNLIFFSFFYWVMMLTFETGSYHWLNVQNSATSMYPGLAFCDCLHAPLWMQTSYFMFGPAFFVIGAITKKATRPLKAFVK